MTTKVEIIKKIAEKHPHLTQRDLELIVNQFFKGIENYLRNGGDFIEFRGFGVFSMRYRKARVGRNPNTGEAVYVPKKRVLRFVASKKMREVLNQ